MYIIRNLSPRTDIHVGAHGFCIELCKEWPELVRLSELTQEKVEHKILKMGAEWLDACGYDRMYDPNNPGREARSRDMARMKPEVARGFERLHGARSIRVQWGKWGIEHLDVPGNACGLDIDKGGMFSLLPGSAILQPHNIDCWSQKNLLLIVFTSIAEDVLIFSRPK